MSGRARARGQRAAGGPRPPPSCMLMYRGLPIGVPYLCTKGRPCL
nr:MAG TPA: hypothetical protein [Caudoviricetes sp.]